MKPLPEDFQILIVPLISPKPFFAVTFSGDMDPSKEIKVVKKLEDVTINYYSHKIPSGLLSAQAETVNYIVVLLDVFPLEIIKQPAAL